MAAKSTDLTGQKVGLLTVVRRADKKRNRSKEVIWECLCSCGSTVYRAGNCLRRKRDTMQSCGCHRGYQPGQKFVDMTGQRFGYLTVISRSENKGRRRVYWDCLCDCGNITSRAQDKLKRGYKDQSCGCNHHLPEHRLIDLTGQEFGRLTVIKYIGQEMWECLCSCGEIAIKNGEHLRNGSTASCGCWNRRIKHGHSLSSGSSGTYDSWKGMMQRCLNPKNTRYSSYGGRGIKVCEEWRKFANFLADMGERPEGLTLERKDVNGDYCPEDCEWATMHKQMRNRQNTRLITMDGRTQCLKDWCNELGRKTSSVCGRIKAGWSIEDALLIPPGTTRKYKNFRKAE